MERTDGGQERVNNIITRDSQGLSSHLALLHSLLFEGPVPAEPVLAKLIERLGDPTPQQIWLILAVLRARLPYPEDVVNWHRRARAEGAAVVLAELSKHAGQAVRILEGGVVVDAHNTVSSGLSTGIQRVVRNVLDRWSQAYSFSLLAWDGDFGRLHQAPDGAHRVEQAIGHPAGAPSIIPWKSTYLLPELSVEQPRLRRIQALAEYSGSATGVIGYDTVPMTSAETSGPGMPAAFAQNLAAVARMDRVATISEAAATEYEGWRVMIESAGLVGPTIRAIELPMQPIPDADPSIDSRKELGLTAAPIVVCVGSHEPRKNHVAVLHAAEVLWREGHEFQLVFCGGNAWNSSLFTDRLAELRAAKRTVSSHSKVSDAVLNGLVRVARFSVFPSLNEGYGLPIAESLVAGTPVVTSNFGSMAEIAKGGGALLVDPRDDSDLVNAMRRMLDDDELLERLRAEALALPTTSWAAYADGLWSYFVD
jgi:glycosyltransferase involved in cell wall biosynthesis